jgi:DNA repair protein RadC
MTNEKEISEPHYLDHRARLRNRFLEQGINSLQPYEIIELFLTFVIPQKDVKLAAKQAIERFGTIKGFFDADEKELSQIPYFKDKALTLRLFIKEVALLYQKQQAEQIPVSQSKDEFMKYCREKLGYKKEEEFWMLSLDSRNVIIKENLISKGLTDKTPVYPRQVIETAMKNGAHSILLLHNHTNGNPQASEQDITITKAIDIPARLLNISIYDHIIIAGENYFSFRENKII